MKTETLKQILLPGILLSSLFSFAAAEELPVFGAYPVDRIHEGTLERVDLDSHPDARMFRTRLRANEGKPPNFAGHYIITLWGCGTMCQMVAIIDTKSGRVDFPLEDGTGYGVCYKADSRLLITNPLTEEDVRSFDGRFPEWLKTGYYDWDGDALHLVTENREVNRQACDVPVE